MADGASSRGWMFVAEYEVIRMMFVSRWCGSGKCGVRLIIKPGEE